MNLGPPGYAACPVELGAAPLSELGANQRKSDLKEAFVVPGTAVRRHLMPLIAAAEAERLALPRAQLLPLLEQIGAADAPLSEIPARLHAAVMGARAQASALPVRTNDGQDVDAVIAAARQQVGRFAFSDALATLEAKLAEEEEARARRLLPLLREQAAVLALAFDGAGRRATLRRIAELDAANPWAWFDLGDAHWEAGEREAARAAYVRGRDAADQRGDQRDVSVSHIKLGDVLLAEGKRAAALDSYRASLAIREALARQDAGNAEWQRHFSVSHNRIGDTLLVEGKRAEALDAYRAALAIREALARQGAGNALWQHDLVVSHIKIGNMLLAERQRPEALEAYRAALAIAEALVRQDAGNADWQRGLSVSHNKIGDVLLTEGKHVEALDAYRAALVIAEALARQDAGNAEWQRDLSVSHIKIGDVLWVVGKRTEVLDAYRTALAIAEALVRQDPGNVEWQRDVSVSHNKIGDVLLAEGKRAEALDAYRAGLAIAEALARQDAGNAKWQRDLLVSWWKLAEAEPEAARGHLERAIAIEAELRVRGALAPVDDWVAEALATKLADLH